MAGGVDFYMNVVGGVADVSGRYSLDGLVDKSVFDVYERRLECCT